MKASTLKLPEPLDHRLTLYATQNGMSKSEVVRQAIEEYLDKAPEASPQSATVAAAKWAGIVNGPEDLSTNPAYFEGFGR